jgi:DNA-binding transcriptional LysR family regulator
MRISRAGGMMLRFQYDSSAEIDKLADSLNRFNHGLIMLDRLSSMSIFVDAVERRSFTAAADHLGLSCTMVGKHIQSLEKQVGAKLLNRSTRKQSLTEVGRIYYDHCKQILADFESASECADKLRISPRGVLKIHAPVSFGSQRLAPMLGTYLDRYPEVKVELTLSDRSVDIVEEGYEAAICIGQLSDSELIAKPLKPYTMWLCASPTYLEKAGTLTTPQDLSAHNCLGFSYWRRKDHWQLRNGDETNSIPVQGRLTVNNGQALRMAAVAHMGVIMQPEVLVAEDVTAGRLVRLLQDWELPLRPMYIVYHADRRPTPKLRTFIDFIAESFG